MEEKLKNLKLRLEKINQQIEEAPGWGAYAIDLIEKQRGLIKQIAYYEKEIALLKKR